MRNLAMATLAAVLVLVVAPGCSSTEGQKPEKQPTADEPPAAEKKRKQGTETSTAPAEEPNTTSPPRYESTVIEEGETLYSLANEHDVSVEAILEANDHIEDPRDIEVGEIVLIPVTGSDAAPEKEAPAEEGKDTEETGRQTKPDTESGAQQEPSSPDPEDQPETRDVPDSALHRGNPGAPFWWPTAGEVIPDSENNLRKSDEPGIGIAAPGGQEVCAVADGKVIATTYSGKIGGGGRGQVVVIRHSPEMLSWYGLLSKKTVQKGEQVKKGQRIGRVSPKGVDGQTQLEFKMFRNEKEIDPVSHLP